MKNNEEGDRERKKKVWMKQTQARKQYKQEKNVL